jgi:CheY-like chemotaxis protein
MIATSFENKDRSASSQPFVLTEEHEYAQKYSDTKIKTNHDKKNPVILLVEDEADVRTFIREYFTINYQIIEASNGIVGLEMAIRNNPDIIISDIIMPLMDGVEMCKIKRRHQDKPYAHLMLTANHLENKIEGLGTGADAYVEKPFLLICLKFKSGTCLRTEKYSETNSVRSWLFSLLISLSLLWMQSLFRKPWELWKSIYQMLTLDPSNSAKG